MGPKGKNYEEQILGGNDILTSNFFFSKKIIRSLLFCLLGIQKHNIVKEIRYLVSQLLKDKLGWGMWPS